MTYSSITSFVFVLAVLAASGCNPDDIAPPDVFVDYDAHGRFLDAPVFDTQVTPVDVIDAMDASADSNDP